MSMINAKNTGIGADGNDDISVQRLSGLNRLIFISIILFFVWIWVGILFYTYYDGFTMATAYFYTIEAGMSVGFCNPGI